MDTTATCKVVTSIAAEIEWVEGDKGFPVPSKEKRDQAHPSLCGFCHNRRRFSHRIVANPTLLRPGLERDQGW